MAYCTKSDILNILPEAELVQLTTDTGSTVDDSVVGTMIAWADAEIDAYLGNRYQVPVNPVPEKLKALSVDIAVYRLYCRRSSVPDARLNAYRDAVTFLRQVASGKSVIMYNNSEIPRSSVLRHVADFTSATKIFGRDNMSGY